MPRQEFEYFTKPFVSVKRLPSNGGVTSWPCEVSNIAQQVPACLPAPTLQGLVSRFVDRVLLMYQFTHVILGAFPRRPPDC